MMTFLKSLWRKLFKRKRVYQAHITNSGQVQLWDISGKIKPRKGAQVYDPSEDPEKILKGEFESYFD